MPLSRAGWLVMELGTMRDRHAEPEMVRPSRLSTPGCVMNPRKIPLYTIWCFTDAACRSSARQATASSSNATLRVPSSPFTSGSRSSRTAAAKSSISPV